MLSGSAVSASVSNKVHKSKLKKVKAPKQHHIYEKSGNVIKEAGAKGTLYALKKVDEWAGKAANAIGPIKIDVRRRL